VIVCYNKTERAFLEGKTREFSIDGTEAVRFHGRLCAPEKSLVKEDIVSHISSTPYILEREKMHQDLKKTYWWKRMKVDVAKYVPSCGVYQRVKVEHTRSV
jgi:hypothetical protein